MNRSIAVAAAALCIGLAPGAQASSGFFNDFSQGLASNETVAGAFTAADGYMGHHGASYSPNAHDSYTINFDTAGFANPVLSFDYDYAIEAGYDFLNVADIARDAAHPGNTVTTNLASFTGAQSGTASYVLARQTTSVRFDFQSDSIVQLRGVKLDNVRIYDVPEFFNDFSAGLSRFEEVTGAFAVGNGYLGHQGFYSPNASDTYTINFDTANFADPMLSFDLSYQIESGYDFLYVYDYSEGANPLLLATYTGFQSGPVTFSLAPRTTAVKFVFHSDSIVQFQGVRLDNVHIFDGANVAAVPEPASWAMMILGFALAGASARRRSGKGGVPGRIADPRRA